MAGGGASKRAEYASAFGRDGCTAECVFMCAWVSTHM